MKYSHVFCILTIQLLISIPTKANESLPFDFTAGYGSLTSGFGVNLSLESERGFGFVSLGCQYLNSSDIVDICGGGVGYQIAPFKSALEHSIGISYGNIGKGRSGDTEYGISTNYTYYFNEINNSGFWVGAGYQIGPSNDDLDEFFFNIGYNF